MSRGAMVRRTIRLNSEVSREALQELNRWPGVHRVVLRHHRLALKYDAGEIQWTDIERWMSRHGVVARGTWVRFKSAWYRYVDANARLNARSRTGHCCNKPPALPRKRGL